MVRILIADDHGLFRQGLRTFLQDSVAGADIVEAEGLDSALEALGRDQPFDLVVTDLRMPGMDGPQSLTAFREAFPAVKLLVMSGLEDRSTVLASLGAGAHGYVPKSARPEVIADAITTVMAGRIWVPSALASWTPQAEPAPATASATSNGSNGPRLTPRQRDVLKLLLRGASTKEIARELALGEGTVKVHLAGLYRALGARNRTEATAIGARLSF
jgi:DNA-binding NarL/FixJ family response regulator